MKIIINNQEITIKDCYEAYDYTQNLNLINCSFYLPFNESVLENFIDNNFTIQTDNDIFLFEDYYVDEINYYDENVSVIFLKFD